MSWADENSISCWDYEDLIQIRCIEGEFDDQKFWVTREEKEIKYEDLSSPHIENIIKKFEYTKEEMPNLFEEYEKRLSKLKDNK